MAKAENMVKVLFKDGKDVETLWAVPVSGNLYCLDNSPFHVNGVSWEDIVHSVPDKCFLIASPASVVDSGPSIS